MERATPKTDFAAFTITAKDVGSPAVRLGHMAELEQERQVLLLTAKLILQRAKNGQATLDSVSEFSLGSAVKVVEGGDLIADAKRACLPEFSE